MGDQRVIGTIKPSKKYATDRWKQSAAVTAVLEAEEARLKGELKANSESLKEARAVEHAAKVDLLRLLDDEEPTLPGVNREPTLPGA